MDTVWSAQSLRSLMRKSSPREINMLYQGCHGQGKVREIPVFLRVREKSGIFFLPTPWQLCVHRGLTSHFKVPKKPAPKSSMQFRPPVHQRPKGQQNKSQNSNLFSNARIAGGPLPRNPSRRTKGGGAKKMAGPFKGAQQWRSVGGGSPSCCCPAMAKPARWVQINKDHVVGCPVEVGISSASFDKDAH